MTAPGPFPFAESPIRDGDPAHAAAWWMKFFRHVQNRLDFIALDGGVWHNPPLTNGWVAWGSPYATAGEMRWRGVVYMRGLVKNGAVGAICNITDPTLWPYRKLTFACIGSSTANGYGLARVDVDVDGTVSLQGNAYGADGFVSLAGISWALGEQP